jgi:hypothetical protein
MRPSLQKAGPGEVMMMFVVLGVIFAGLFLAPLFGRDRPVARY